MEVLLPLYCDYFLDLVKKTDVAVELYTFALGQWSRVLNWTVKKKTTPWEGALFGDHQDRAGFTASHAEKFKSGFSDLLPDHWKFSNFVSGVRTHKINTDNFQRFGRFVRSFVTKQAPGEEAL